jgi:hypothetical protein
MRVHWAFLPAAVLYTVVVWTRLGVLAVLAGLALGIVLTAIAAYRARRT